MERRGCAVGLYLVLELTTGAFASLYPITLGLIFSFSTSSGSEHYPLQLRRNCRPSVLHRDIREVQKDVLDLLKRGEVPTNVETKFSFKSGGVSPNHVLAAALHYAKDGSSGYEGDGSFYETLEDQLDELPECENAEDWELMRCMIGVSKQRTEGYGHVDEALEGW